MTGYKHKHIILFFCFVFLCTACFAQYSDGDGSKSNPYRISNVEDLKTLAKQVNGGEQYSDNNANWFKVTCDIDCGGALLETIGSQTPAKSFNGKFDGNGKTIKNFRIKNESSKNTVGLGFFGYLYDASVENLTLDNVTIETNVDSKKYCRNIGVLTGHTYRATIENCNVSNSSVVCKGAKTNSNGYNIGGIVGYVQEETEIISCSVTDTKLEGNEYIGGICGQTYTINKLTMTDCYVKNNNLVINGGSFLGYFCGNNDEKYNVNNDVLLRVNHWNLIARLGSTFDILSSNNEGNDIAAVKFDYTTQGDEGNKWNETDYLTYKDDMQEYSGYFVWAFDKDEKGNELSNTFTRVTPNYLSQSQITIPALTNQGNAFKYSGNGGKEITAHWFALGNPFDTPINVSDIINNVNTVQGGLVYVYNPITDMWNNKKSEDGDAVLPGQGFMVAGASNQISGKLVKSSGKKLKKDSKEQSNIKILCRTATKSKLMEFNISPFADNGFDLNDAFVLFSDNNDDLVEPYCLVENRQIMINTVKTLPYSCQMNFHSLKAQEVQLSITHIAEGVTVSLIDRSEGTEIVLDSVWQTVSIDEGENENRFVLKVSSTENVALAETIEPISVDILTTGNTVSLKTNADVQIRITDVLGRIVENRTVRANSTYEKTLYKGAYVLCATDGKQVTSYQFIIN